MYIKSQTTIVLYNSDTIVTDNSKEYVKIWVDFVAQLGNHNKIKAIKMIRAEFDCGLREAKIFVEEAMESAVSH